MIHECGAQDLTASSEDTRKLCPLQPRFRSAEIDTWRYPHRKELNQTQITDQTPNPKPKKPMLSKVPLGFVAAHPNGPAAVNGANLGIYVWRLGLHWPRTDQDKHLLRSQAKPLHALNMSLKASIGSLHGALQSKPSGLSSLFVTRACMVK